MHQIEGGVKYIFRQNTSTSENFRNDTLNVSNGNNLDYNQYILGAYLGYVWKLKKISTKTGLRIERTWNDGESVTSGVSTDFTNRLFNLVPYITLNWMPTAAQTVKLSYTQRLSRPGIWYLNPYVYDIDSMNIRYGNPRLEAEIAHSFELGYTYFTPKFNISVTSSASFVNNSIESISSVKPNGASETTYKNIGKDQRYGVNIYANYRPSGKLNAYFNGGISYSKLEANTAYAITNEGFSGRGSFGGRWTAWKDGSVNVNAGLFSADIMLQGKSSTFFYTSIGVSQYLLKRKMMLGFSASDPFWRTKTYVFDSEDITFKSHNVSSFLAQTLRFNVTYNFGKMDLQVKKARRGIQNDDVKSGGNSDQGQGQ
jgi:outer membrane receptor protein involved in Fe transport